MKHFIIAFAFIFSLYTSVPYAVAAKPKGGDQGVVCIGVTNVTTGRYVDITTPDGTICRLYAEGFIDCTCQQPVPSDGLAPFLEHKEPAPPIPPAPQLKVDVIT